MRQLCLTLFLAVLPAYALAGDLVSYGNLSIKNGGVIKFPDGTVQSTATLQGPKGVPGPQGPTGPQGAVGLKGDTGPAGQVTLESVCAAISSSGSVLPPFCPNPNKLIGAWYIPYPNGGEAKGPIVYTFIDGSKFMIAIHGEDIPSGEPGIEWGTYTWDSSTGSFSASVTVDTTFGWGFSHATWPKIFAVSADGNTLLVDGVAFASRVVRTANNPLIGSWYVPYPNGGQAKGPIVFTFIDGSSFMMAHDGDRRADPYGEPGMELGNYNWNPVTGEFSTTLQWDSNGEWGFSHAQKPMYINVSADGGWLVINGAPFAKRVQ